MTELYSFDEFQLDTAAKTLTRADRPVPLPPRAMQLLVALVENRHRVVGKEELIRIAWPNAPVVENNLPVAIFALRQAFSGRFYIRNEYGKGYSFVAPLQAAAVDAGPALPSEQPGIAVLSFAGPSPGRDDEMVGDGVAEGIIAALSRNRWLRVIARNSSFSYKSGQAGLDTIAQQLGVRYVLDGNVRRSGDRLRFTAHLNDAIGNRSLFTHRDDRVMTDVFVLQDEIAGRIAEAVRPVLFEAEQERSFRTHPERVDAWLAYQRGIWYLSQRGEAELRTSMEWFNRAISLDARFAPGHYGMSRLLCRAGSGYSATAPDDWQVQGELFAQQAVNLDPWDSSAHAALSYARFTRGDHAGAVAAAEPALSLNPSDSGAWGTLGAARVFSGRHAEGIEALHTSIDLDPRDPRVHVRQMQIGLGFYFMDDMAAAESHAAMMTQTWPGYSGSARLMAMVLAETGRHDEAIAWIERSKALWPAPFDDFSHARMPWYRPDDFRRVLTSFWRAGWRGPGGA